MDSFLSYRYRAKFEKLTLGYMALEILPLPFHSLIQ